MILLSRDLTLSEEPEETNVFELLNSTEESELTETTAYNDYTELMNKLDTVIEGEQAINHTLWLIYTLLIVVTGVKLLWTVFAKWFFGGI